MAGIIRLGLHLSIQAKNIITHFIHRAEQAASGGKTVKICFSRVISSSSHRESEREKRNKTMRYLNGVCV